MAALIQAETHQITVTFAGTYAWSIAQSVIDYFKKQWIIRTISMLMASHLLLLSAMSGPRSTPIPSKSMGPGLGSSHWRALMLVSLLGSLVPFTLTDSPLLLPGFLGTHSESPTFPQLPVGIPILLMMTGHGTRVIALLLLKYDQKILSCVRFKGVNGACPQASAWGDWTLRMAARTPGLRPAPM